MSNLKEHQEPSVSLSEILKSAGYVAGAGVAATVGGVVALGTTACRCGSSSSEEFNYEAWAETDGAAGRINMDEVRDAFEQASSSTDFEDRINRIYEGEHPVLIRVQNVGNEQRVEGWEDLDDNGEITDASDDKLFTLTRTQGQQARLEGHGANGYYRHHYPMGYSPMGGFWTGFLIANMMRPGFMYNTAPGRRMSIINNTRAYRNSSAFSAQQSRNRAFFGRQASNPGYAASRNSASSARQSFRGRVRSQGGSFRGSYGRAGSSGFRGGGR